MSFLCAVDFIAEKERHCSEQQRGSSGIITKLEATPWSWKETREVKNEYKSKFKADALFVVKVPTPKNIISG